MNEETLFTDFLNAVTDPLYESKGKKKCRKGYKWDAKIGGCIPIGAPKSKNDEDKTSAPPEDYDGFNVWGSTGMDGGYALEVPPDNK